jgi:hypothetical protein
VPPWILAPNSSPTISIRDAAAEAVASMTASMIVEEVSREGMRVLVVGDILYTASGGKTSLVCSVEARWRGTLTKKSSW